MVNSLLKLFPFLFWLRRNTNSACYVQTNFLIFSFDISWIFLYSWLFQLIHRLVSSFVFNILPRGFYSSVKFNVIFSTVNLFATIRPQIFSISLKSQLDAGHRDNSVPKPGNQIFVLKNLFRTWKITFLSSISSMEGDHFPPNVSCRPAAIVQSAP